MSLLTIMLQWFNKKVLRTCKIIEDNIKINIAQHITTRSKPFNLSCNHIEGQLNVLATSKPGAAASWAVRSQMWRKLIYSQLNLSISIEDGDRRARDSRQGRLGSRTHNRNNQTRICLDEIDP
jgi:hypothetical protein